MGGKAFPELNVVRLDSGEYHSLESYLHERLIDRFSGTIFEPIVSYRMKESFGDMDILYCERDLLKDLMSKEDLFIFLQSISKDVHQLSNGPVTSYAVTLHGNRFFQIDFIKVKKDCFDFSSSYFAYNDLGNLMGRIFHWHGLKLGHEGLKYIIRDESNYNHIIDEYTITKNWKEAITLFDYDHERWIQGFDTIEDIFEYAVSIPLASKEIFRLDRMNHRARVRDRKRLTYQLFLKWINTEENHITVDSLVSKRECRSMILEKLFELYPVFKHQFVNCQKAIEVKNRVKGKFNGNVFRSVTGLNGTELGLALSNFKKTIDDFDQWVIKASPSEIESRIMNFQESNQ